MIAGEGTQIIRRPAKEIFEFVLDPESYKKADFKIGTVHSLTWRDGQAEIHYSGCFRGWPTPSVRQLIKTQPYSRIDVLSKPGTVAHFVSRFHGTFTFEELGTDATTVFHREELVFLPPLNLVLEPLLRSWIEHDTPQEVLRLKTLLEATL